MKAICEAVNFTSPSCSKALHCVRSSSDNSFIDNLWHSLLSNKAVVYNKSVVLFVTCKNKLFHTSVVPVTIACDICGIFISCYVL